MDPHRLADVRAGTDTAAKSDGSGYLIGPRLILTARHIVIGPDGQPWPRIEVRIGHPADGEPRRAGATLCWPDSDHLDEHDVALLRLDADDAAQPPGPPVRWARLTGTEAQQYTGMGFPRFAEYNANIRGVEQLNGELNPLSTGPDGGYVLDQHAAPDPAPGEGRAWSGVSGAAVFSGGFLVGLVTKDDDFVHNRRLHAVPVHDFASDPDFVRLVREDTGAPPFLQSVELAGLFAPWVEAAPAGTPGSLLAAAVEAVDFYGRNDILSELVAWRDDPWPFSIMLITGEGGQGKTRLAREFIRHSRADGWVAGFSIAARGTSNNPGVDPQTLTTHIRRLQTGTTPVLIVADYAETHPDFIETLATKLLSGPSNRPVRLLLLSRTVGSWWGELCEEMPGGAATTKALAPLTDDPDSRTRVYQAAVTGLAGRLPSLPEPAIAAQSTELWSVLGRRLIDEPPPLNDATYDNALNLQMAALLDLIRLASGAEWLPTEGPEETLVRHERDYRKRLARRRGLLDKGELSALSDPDDRAKAAMELLDRALAGVILLGPCTAERAQAIGALASEERAADVTGWLCALYPSANDDGLGQVQPDRLAEFLLGRILTAPGHEDLLARIGQLAPEPHASYTALFALARTAAHPPFTGKVGAGIADLITLYPDPFATAATLLAATIEQRHLLIEGLVRLGGQHPEAFRLSVLGAYSVLPHASMRTAFFSVSMMKVRTDLFNELLKTSRGPEFLDTFAEFAFSVSSQAVRLAAVGQYRDALQLAKAARQYYFILALFDPDTHVPNLAMSLTNLSNRLAAVGQHRNALPLADEAVDLYRTLAQDNPDAHLPNLATALTTLGGRLSEIGQHQDALPLLWEALTIRRTLAKTNPDDYLPDLANSLTNLAGVQAEIGQLRDALSNVLQAVGINRALVEANPDAHLPAYMRGIGQLGHVLIENARFREAVGPLVEVIVEGKRTPAHLQGMVIGMVKLAIDELRRAYMADPGVADEFQKITGEEAPDWIKSKPDSASDR